MNLRELARRVDKSKGNEDSVDTSLIGEELNVDIPWTEQERLKCYWVGNWYCTDTYVGYKLYFLDDEPVAFTMQVGRKWQEEFRWFGDDAAMKVKKYLLSLIMEDEGTPSVAICDLDEDLGDSFKIEFSGQVIRKDMATLDGEKVEIVERIKNKPHGIDDLLRVKLPSGETKEVEIMKLDFGFYIV